MRDRLEDALRKSDAEYPTSASRPLPRRGSISKNVLLGYKIENSEVVGRVKDMMLAGNAYDALKDIVAIGDKAEWLSAFGGTHLVPAIRFGALSVVTR